MQEWLVQEMIMASLASGDSSQLVPAEADSEEGPDDGGGWYFSRKEIEENSPSRSDAIDLQKETYLRKSYCTFLQDLGMRLKVPQVTIATAIIFCHRFYLRQSHAKNDRKTVATACMFLAGKVEETPRPLKDVILVSYEIIHKKDPAAIQKIKQKEVYEEQKELILIAERVVLATIGFDMNVLYPYKPLVEGIKKFKVAQHTLAQVAWNFVNDGLRTSLCLQFKPHHIAAGAIFLAAKFLKVKLPSDGEKVWWQEFDVTPRQLEEVSNQMLELYEQSRPQPNQGSETEGSVAGGTANRAASRTSTEDHFPNGNSSQSGATAKSGAPKPPAAYQPIDHSNKHSGPTRGSQSMSSDFAGSDKKIHEKQRVVEQLGHQEWNSSEDSKEKSVNRNRTREVGEAKVKKLSNSVEVKETGSTLVPCGMIEKIDANKLKELREKRKKSRGDVIRKKDTMDEFDSIVMELEEGVELAAAAESEKIKQERNQETFIDVVNGEEGELSALDDSSWDYHSPKLNGRKRKVGSPGDKTNDGKRRRDSIQDPRGII
ncbi:hypothetical protein RND81_05G163900 [Saponaria officinalis]|uniref:Cyclin-like domain-containing protein n=1 Tax=Saponaria officinalis TaxID=3572 RepID=A0AAW1KYA3_SAPOF